MIIWAPLMLAGVLSVGSAFWALFSRRRSILAASTVVLTLSLGAMMWMTLGSASVLWILPIYLTIDIVMMYIMYSMPMTGSLGMKQKRHQEIYFATILTLLITALFAAIWGIWNWPEAVIDWERGIREAGKNNLNLWGDRWLLVLLCLTLLAPTSIGVLLLVRQRD